ncbi:PH domain-containing protein [Lachnospiraceae bacterium DSM 108991]|uniref:PH domain-containing protein n=1 Tax=Claveliimonas monacensis TaxID=2779351 RepID=A0ABR9RJ12_9FIRM|nr:PH domain-containing protein [Claveliimonas monacensis]MBE5062597.1 PH domain-containing protein [Claveliimonas monacensis]
MVYEKLSKNALRCMYAAGAVTGVILLAVIGAVDYFWVFPEDIVIGKWISLGAALFILADVCVSPWFRFCRYRYGINEECIDIQEGYLFVKRHIVPIERLHKLEMRTGPLDRAFGVAKVIVTTAGGDVTIAFLDTERAERIADTLRKRINAIAAEQREERREMDHGRE